MNIFIVIMIIVWYSHVLSKDEDNLVRGCLSYKIDSGIRKKSWKEVVDSDLKCLHLRASDALDFFFFSYACHLP